MKKLIFSIITLIGIIATVNAQEVSRRETKGDKHYFVYSFDKAIDCYTHTKQLSVEGQRKLAKSYINMGRNIESEAIWLDIINGKIRVLAEDYYNYAMTLKSNGKYEEAAKWMMAYSKLRPDDTRAGNYQFNNRYLSNLQNDNGIYTIRNLDINSDADEFGLCYYYNNKVVYSTSRTGTKMIVRKYNWTGKPFWDMYIADVDSGQLVNSEKFSKKLNGKLHDGPASYSNNGNFIAFTRNNYNKAGKDRVVELQIFFSSSKDGKWLEPEPFFLNSEEYSVGQPCLTSDGNVMYFTSDMPGGMGGTDIYKVTKTAGGKWGNKENLGNTINTEGDEMFPFLDEKNRTFYFSSNGHYGLGGLDIFVSELNGSGFSQVYNAGSPLNSQYDDFSAVVSNKERNGYFISNRAGGSGGDDIYSFAFIDVVKSAVPDIQFIVHAPENIPEVRRVRETFPIRNYIFFDLGSTEIPDRYVMLKKDQVKGFKEDRLEVFTPKKLSGRSNRQMIAYYNVMNILGDRMGRNPAAVVRLSGSSMQGDEDGLAMAESVKKYLVDIFGIKASRIKTEGRIKPRIPSEKEGFTKELDLLREGDRRVSVWSETPELMMEFQTGPDAPLKPVEIISNQETPLDSYISFSVDGGKDSVSSWELIVTDKMGTSQRFGPYTMNRVYMSGKTFLKAKPEGDFKVTMIAQTSDGTEVVKDTTVHMVLWTPSEREEGMRFSVLYEFNQSESILIYDKYLTDVVVPKIPAGATVIISGYTDVVGTESHNMELSLARAKDVSVIIKDALAKSGRTDVKFEVNGFGEDNNLSPFENGSPEERFYNRTVIIDIIPAKQK
jgi:outer membrane protein OmpA-like peptidoglycan-associated protein